ncbi:MAG: hypothetical protein Q4D98_05190 [Planctomycetia bacterium]|nr:hypothetical protein [Planctomycetia bacterium]
MKRAKYLLWVAIIGGWTVVWGQTYESVPATMPPAPSAPGGSTYGIQDPYAMPADTSRPLFDTPASACPAASCPTGSCPTNSCPTSSTRLFQNFGVDFTWITPKSGVKQMGLFRIDTSGDIAFPVFGSTERPLMLEPRFAINWWNGPKSDWSDMASSTFDASLGLRWMPQLQLNCFSTALEFDLFFSVGLYSDFKKVSSHSFRFPSWAYVSLDLTKTIKAKIGVWYLDRVRYKIFPSGGVVWSPNNQWEFQILFPNPRVTYRPVGGGLRDLSLYARGEYGGGSWTVDHVYGGDFRTDYNDYRIMFGFDWSNRYKATGYFELGIAFARELYFDDPRGAQKLDAGFMLETGFRF